MQDISDKKRILIIEDNCDFASVLKEFLLDEDDFEILNVIGNESDALKFIESDEISSIDCILLDLGLPRNANDSSVSQNAGLRILERARGFRHFYGTIIVLTSSRNPEDGHKALASGCDGYICKSIPTENLFRTLEELKIAIRGNNIVISREMRHVFLRTDISVRESQLLDLLARGHGWADVASRLGYSTPKAAANIDDRIFDKLFTDEDRRMLEGGGIRKKAKAIEIWRLRRGADILQTQTKAS